ncbi:MAG: type IV pilin-like G/H family protein [Limnospira sp. PMC 1291.21]|uniref:Uncharacterized protein n=3 Tax=Limnospira TaxID=2596745 RepID=B5W6A5_LIMMA|nr:MULTISPECIES: type IV pilin-like G/H family protein [Limnospira]EKD09326.1 hypothetical protein SPLC1_S207280 [Arthrospira platensis C1]MBD2709595.1 type IV pilin-like G/H family protein [Arthrospira platensis FACHB-835]MDC0837099.1 type IV pilin-like G/H family protein [Limnoraphis robusta]MDY7051039.1 type IV pilin-like G/H family protein [Limnospira fusiformis LS22]QJB24706.1 general secretion pathway protein GspH [Limnospira fusiformis SAG 85.79]RAQ42762.1 general secretion pathway pro
MMWKYLIFLAPIVLTGCQVDFSSVLEDIPGWRSSDRAPLMMKAIALGQQTYYQNQGYFASSLHGLSGNLNLETDSYQYAIRTEGETAQTVFITATAKTDDLRSYSGVMTVGKNDGGVVLMANLCQTDTPSKVPPLLSSTPVPSQGLKCPPGSSPVR